MGERKGQVDYGSYRACLGRMGLQMGHVNLSVLQREPLLLVFLAVFVFLIYSNSLQAPPSLLMIFPILGRIPTFGLLNSALKG